MGLTKYLLKKNLLYLYTRNAMDMFLKKKKKKKGERKKERNAMDITYFSQQMSQLLK